MRPRMPVAAALALTIGLAGCVDDDRSFFIRQNQIPDPGCTVSASPKEVSRWAGTYDLKPEVHSGGLYPYLMNPVVENQMASTAGDKQPERNRIHIRRFEISLELEGGGNFPDSSFPATGVIDPNGTFTFGGVPVIPPQIASQISIGAGEQRMMTIKLRAVGERSGDTLESAEFVYPVTLCNGCLVDWQDQCPADTANVLSNPCGIPQDTAVTCCPSGQIPTCYSN